MQSRCPPARPRRVPTRNVLFLRVYLLVYLLTYLVTYLHTDLFTYLLSYFTFLFTFSLSYLLFHFFGLPWGGLEPEREQKSPNAFSGAEARYPGRYAKSTFLCGAFAGWPFREGTERTKAASQNHDSYHTNSLTLTPTV